MEGRLPRFYNTYSEGTSTMNQRYGMRQPLYLQPSYISPRGIPNSNNFRINPESPDFIPLGFSSPVIRAQQNWNSQRNRSNNTTSSGWSSHSSSNSSMNFSPYNKHGSRGSFRRRGSFSNSNPHENSRISVYLCREALENPWAELEKKMNLEQMKKVMKPEEQQNTSSSTIVKRSDSDVLRDGS